MNGSQTTYPKPGEIYSPLTIKTIMKIVLGETLDVERWRNCSMLQFQRFVEKFDCPPVAYKLREMLRADTEGKLSAHAEWLRLSEACPSECGTYVRYRGGPDEFYSRVEMHISNGDKMVDAWSRQLPKSVRRYIDFDADAWTINDPIRLLRTTAEAQARGDTRLAEHAAFRLSLGLLRLLNDIADPRQYRELGLQILHEERNKQLFEEGVKKLYLVYRRCNKTGRIHGVKNGIEESEVPENCRIYDSASGAKRYRRSCEKQNPADFYIRSLNCRVIHVGDKTFYVYYDRRNKDADSILLKNLSKIYENLPTQELKSEFSKDNRGSRYCFAAIDNGDGKLRVPTRRDLESLRMVILRHLWDRSEFLSDPLIEGNEDNAGRTYRSSIYYDLKILGTVSVPVEAQPWAHRFSGMDWPRGCAEEILMTIWDYVSCDVSREQDNHDIRKFVKLCEFFVRSLPSDIVKKIRPLIVAKNGTETHFEVRTELLSWMVALIEDFED